jgi:Ca2+-transporting ATPase
MEYQAKKLAELFTELNSTERGLTSQDARERLAKFGTNEIKETKKISPWKIFLEQFTSPVVWILIAALIISVLVDHLVDAIIIGAILVINAILGFIQEYRAEKAIEALKKVITQQARVIRDGKEQVIPAKDVVPGDIIVLREGEKIPADARLFEANELKTIESSLTGESIPVTKKTGVCTDQIIGNMFNMVFSGTAIATGTGKAVVVGTGMSTEIGKIANLLQETETPETPLQKHLKKLSVSVGIGVIIIAIVIFALEIFRGGEIVNALLSSLALAVAAVPEGLPAVITISLALGVQRMLKRNSLVRKLPSVETLGSCTAICSDKTGTLTKGEMTVKRIFADDQTILVSGSGYEPTGVFDKKTQTLQRLLECGVLCNNAQLEKNGNGSWQVIGDPTEGALLTSGLKLGIEKEYLNHEYRRIKENPFKSERKMMSVVYENKKQRFVFAKGAPEKILSICDQILLHGKKRKITEADKKEILKNYQSYGIAALRVLGFAYKELKGKEDEEKGLVFLGLQGMIDPPREEARIAIERCKTAGIRTIMITGDYEITAKAIAQELGIPGKVVTGAQMDSIDLDAEIENIGVFARVDPKHKLKIVEALQKNGHVVAMTGDGVNDAPALKKADIGIAMGVTGTDVAKESSQIVLLDDNFATIVNAVEEGRNIFSNIREFVEYLFSSNIGEVLVIFTALLMNLPLPLLAIQILWINLLTDGFPALALGVDIPDKNAMLQKPRRHQGVISNKRWIYIFLIGILMMVGTLSLYRGYLQFSEQYAQTMAFTTLVVFQLFNTFNLRSTTRSIFAQNPFGNKWLVGAVALSFLLQLAVIYSPLNIYFRTTPLTMTDWGLVFITSFSVIVLGELVKLFKFIAKETTHNGD